jgi:hypothetical protein
MEAKSTVANAPTSRTIARSGPTRSDAMAPKHHHMPLSGGDRKAFTKELSKWRAMTRIFAERSAEKRREGDTPPRAAYYA